jgi:hypothetical protein
VTLATRCCSGGGPGRLFLALLQGSNAAVATVRRPAAADATAPPDTPSQTNNAAALSTAWQSMDRLDRARDPQSALPVARHAELIHCRQGRNYLWWYGVGFDRAEIYPVESTVSASRIIKHREAAHRTPADLAKEPAPMTRTPQ